MTDTGQDLNPPGSRIAEVEAELQRVVEERDSIRADLEIVLEHVAVLIASLKDAWWIRAAEAYRSLAQMVESHRGVN